MIDMHYIYDLVKSCTACQLSGLGLNEINAKVQALASVDLQTPEMESAAFILGKRARKLGITPPESFPKEELSFVMEVFKNDDLMVEFLKHCPENSKEDVKKLILGIKTIRPDIY